MSIADLKKEIIERVSKVDDEALLAEVMNWITVREDERGVYKLSDAQAKSVAEGLAEYKKGDTVSSADLNREIDKWLEQ